MWWDVQRNPTGQIAAQPRAESSHTGPVLDVSFSGDGQNVVSASADGTVKLWNIAQGGAAQVVGKHQAPVKCARMSLSRSNLGAFLSTFSCAIW